MKNCLGLLGISLIVLLGALGCSSNYYNLRGEGYGEDSLGAPAREARSTTSDIEYWGYNEKARQIERNLSRQ